AASAPSRPGEGGGLGIFGRRGPGASAPDALRLPVSAEGVRRPGTSSGPDLAADGGAAQPRRSDGRRADGPPVVARRAVGTREPGDPGGPRGREESGRVEA